MPDERPIVERVRIECTDCGGLIDADMAIQRDGKPYCGECQDHPISKRPDWLWRKRPDGTYEYWTREKVEIRNYIEQVEAENRNLRESCEILKALDVQKGQIITDLGGEVP